MKQLEDTMAVVKAAVADGTACFYASTKPFKGDYMVVVPDAHKRLSRQAAVLVSSARGQHDTEWTQIYIARVYGDKTLESAGLLLCDLHMGEMGDMRLEKMTMLGGIAAWGGRLFRLCDPLLFNPDKVRWLVPELKLWIANVEAAVSLRQPELSVD